MRLGDQTFVKGLQGFYQRFKFRLASFDDLRESLERVSGKKLRSTFDQWVKRRGAPEIKVGQAKIREEDGGYVLTALLEQVQPGPVYDLRIPIAVTVEGRDRTYQAWVAMRERRFELKVRLPARPLRLDVDPEFDVFRRLDREEIPPALTRAFGAQKMLILLPSSASHRVLQAYRALSRSLGLSGPDDVEVKLDTEVETLPSDRAVTILGWENLFRSEIVSALSGYETRINREGVRIGGIELQRESYSVVLTARHPINKDLSLTWVASDLPRALAGLGRKLPHYHKYSYLGFQGEETVNVLKGRWPVLDSPMTVILPREDGKRPKVDMGKLRPRKPLAILPPVSIESR
jgi:hypothetical protein